MKARRSRVVGEQISQGLAMDTNVNLFRDICIIASLNRLNRGSAKMLVFSLFIYLLTFHLYSLMFNICPANNQSEIVNFA